MDVRTDDFGDASCEKVPDDDAAVVAAHGQQGAPAVECAGEGHADTVQSAICLLTTHIHKHNQTQPESLHHHCSILGAASHMTVA